MAQRAQAGSALLVLSLCCWPQRALAALSVELTASEEMVADMRRSVFVEAVHLQERHMDRCSSTDGPACAAALLSGAPEDARRFADGPGVIPDRLLHDLGYNPAEFATAEYHILDLLQQSQGAASGKRVDALLQGAGSDERPGVLYFTELTPDRTIPLTFSQGLPGNVVATWDGAWVARDCGGASAASASLPAAAADASGAPSVLRAALRSAGAGAAPMVVELTGNIGYLRFSKPVVVRSLWARWEPASGSAPALVGGRLGLDGVWATHLDPDKVGQAGWVDIGGGPLQAVDEIAFVATAGLEIGAMEVGVPSSALSEEHSSALMLTPVADRAPDGELRPRLQVQRETFDPAVASPYLVSLQEVVERGLRFRPLSEALPGSGASGARAPGLLTSRSQLLLQEGDSLEWISAAAQNQAFFDLQMLAPKTFGAPSASEWRDALDGIIDGGLGGAGLPRAVREELREERGQILNAILGWMTGERLRAEGQVARSTSLAMEGSEEDIRSYATLKGWQAKLDLFTCALLHRRHLMAQVLALSPLQQLSR